MIKKLKEDFNELVEILGGYPNDLELVRALRIATYLKDQFLIEKFAEDPDESKALENRDFVEGISDYIVEKGFPNCVSIVTFDHTLLASRGMSPEEFFQLILAILVNIPGVKERIRDFVLGRIF